MNAGHDVLSSRGVPDAEASANTHSMTNALPTVPHRPTTSTENQTAQSPKSLSLQRDGLNTVTVAHGESDPNPAYIESSERDRRPDIPTSTLTDSFPGLPSTSSNNVDHMTELGDSQTPNGHSMNPQKDEEFKSRLAPQAQSSDGGTSMDRWQPSLSPIKAGNTSISPLPYSTHSRTRSNLDARLASGQKRKAAGDFKPILDSPAINSSDESGPARRRSKSTGSPDYGSRIAQVNQLSSPSKISSGSFISPSCPSIFVRGYHTQPPK